MSELGRIYRAGETMPAADCRYCHGTGRLKNVVGGKWRTPRLVTVPCTHVVGDAYGFHRPAKRRPYAAPLAIGAGGLALLIGMLML